MVNKEDKAMIKKIIIKLCTFTVIIAAGIIMSVMAG